MIKQLSARQRRYFLTTSRGEINIQISRGSSEDEMSRSKYSNSVDTRVQILNGAEKYFRNKQKLLDYERDLQLVEAELMRVFY